MGYHKNNNIFVIMYFTQVTGNRNKFNSNFKILSFFLIITQTYEVLFLLWRQAESFDGANNPVVALKGAKVSDFANCSLSTVSSTTLTVNPDIPEAYQLKQW